LDTFGFWANVLDACFLATGKFGKFLNARGNRICFLIDLCCLSYWFWMDLQRGLYSQAASVIISAGIAIYGWRRWGKNKPVKD